MRAADAQEVTVPLDGAYPRHARLWALVSPHLKPGELAHDASHIGRVYRWAMTLASEANADPDHSGAAALVHDLVPIAKDDPDRPLGGERSAAAAGPLLSEAGYAEPERDAIVDAVSTSSWSRGLAARSALGRLLQDADRLDAIGAVGIARCIACAQDMSTPESPGRFYDPADPVALTGRPLDDRRQAIDHFRAKLLTLAEGMHTASARAEAARRHAVMEAFLEALQRETAPVG